VAAEAIGGAGEIANAGSLAAARQFLAERRPDLVILDVGLPDGSGLELLGELKDARGCPIPTVIYSAQDLDPATIGQVDAVLTKSRTPLASLAEVVRSLAPGNGDAS
jgi:DNA-binding NarL/FixJ family response regulator